jgi:predicted dehydrogenase
MKPKSDRSTAATRRGFLKTTAAAAAGALTGAAVLGRAHAAGGDTLKVGLVGCGGRGTGAASQALRADGNVKLIAMGDAFADRLEDSLATLKDDRAIADKLDVATDRRFVGFDAYKQVIDSGVDVVLLATPPHFRPIHLRYAIEKGKHVFCEKPMAVDGPGVRSILESAALAKKKNVNLMSGFCYRYDLAKRETIKRIHDGAIGDLLALHVSYNTGPIWHHGREKSWSDMEWQVRNWYYFVWLSGDHIVEQHVHNLDKARWALADATPIAAVGAGGRTQRTDAKYGNIFDHHSVVFEFPNDVKVFSFCRQWDKCAPDVSDHLIGTKGSCQLMKHSITGSEKWKYTGAAPVMYQQEHDELFAAIRAGRVINDGEFMAHSTLMAIMGRLATYTGQRVTWEQALNSKEDLSPAKYEWGPLAVAPVPVPGKTVLR